MIKKVLIANRGEIALRVMRSCREMGLLTVAVFSDADRTSHHVAYADEAYPIGSAVAKESYLNIEKVIATAKRCGADAIHPGYGFLSENSEFARRCKEEGIIFIGPAAETMEAMGDKIAARKRMIAAGVPVVPGTEQPLQSAEEAVRICNEIGYPVMLKASMGGGGKGMRLIHNESEVVEAYNTARSESMSSFGDDTVYLEKFVEEPHHIEFQILGDNHGNVIHLFDRECSVQRRNQKVVEESPSPFLTPELSNIYMILMLITTIWLGSLGFADDYIKIFKKDKEGLHGKFKIIGQVGLGLIVGLTLYLSPQVVIRENIEIEKPDGQIEVVHAAKEIKATQTTIPFFKSNNFDYADLVGFMGEHAQTAGWILFVIITIFVVTAVSNGANLNDGMDGMAAGNSAIIGLTLGILAYVSSHIEYAGYLNIMYIPGSEELVIFICAFIGALIGFLWYNAYPAQVFMGDTGSLTIGGIIAVYAIIIHKELLIPILCGIFLVENLSVILQRLYYKAGKRKGVKQRLFKRTPIHDHFRTSMSLIEPGCSVVFTKPDKLFHESKITIRFWIVTIVLAAITIITLKIR